MHWTLLCGFLKSVISHNTIPFNGFTLLYSCGWLQRMNKLVYQRITVAAYELPPMISGSFRPFNLF